MGVGRHFLAVWYPDIYSTVKIGNRNTYMKQENIVGFVRLVQHAISQNVSELFISTLSL